MTKSKVLVCFDCTFSKPLPNPAAAPVIIRNHNENHDIFNLHVMRLLERDELQSINQLSYYDGLVFRALCACGQIIDRKTQAGVEYAIRQHMVVSKPWTTKDGHVHEHVFDTDEYESPEKKLDAYGKPYKQMMQVQFRVIPRSQYRSRSKSDEVRLEENMAFYGIKPTDLSKDTAITTYDKDIFWVSTKSNSFNRVNSIIFNYMKDIQCPSCSINYRGIKPEFRNLYWHFYREHYVESKSLNDYTQVYKSKEIEYQPYYYDTALSMLQQLVLVEQAFTSKTRSRAKRYNTFRFNRSANALYQLNRKHGIPANELEYLFKITGIIGYRIGDRLFHGMVWTENEAPDWLEEVVKTMGDELGI